MTTLEPIPELLPITPARIEQVEGQLLKMEQVEAQVVHRFGGGIYVREVLLKSGTLAIGHHHKHEHLNAMVSGRATFLNPDGSTTEYTAPMMKVFPAGRKIAIVHEDMIWQNLYPTQETDSEVLERQLLDKSDTWMNNQAERLVVESFQHQVDRDDFLKAISELGFAPYQVTEISENEADQTPYSGDRKFAIGDSPIHGRGVFATCDIAAYGLVGIARQNSKRTPIGRFTNHSATPNCEMVEFGDAIALVAMVPLHGCKGGNLGTEATIDYRKAFMMSRSYSPKEFLCLP